MIGPRAPHEQRHPYPIPRNTAQRNSGLASSTRIARTVTA